MRFVSDGHADFPRWKPDCATGRLVRPTLCLQRGTNPSLFVLPCANDPNP